MDNKYTIPQKYAIEREYGDILLSAAAGSGKTFTLSRRIVELVKSGKADIDNMLVVTFTRSAAADMKAKIAKELSRAALEAKDIDSTGYQRLLESANKTPSADISTIDSFLNRIVKRNLSELGIPQDSRLVSNDSIINNLKSEAMRETVNDFFDKNDASFIKLADILATVKETEQLDGTLMKIANDLTQKCLEPSVLGKYADLLDSGIASPENFLSSPYGKPVKSNLESFLLHFKSVFEISMNWFDNDDHRKLYLDAEELIKWIDIALNTADTGNFISVISLIQNHTFQSKPHKTKKHDPEISDLYTSLRKEFMSGLKKWMGIYSPFTAEDIMLSKSQTSNLLRMIEHALSIYLEKFRAKKRELSILDFNDLLRYSLTLLTDENGNPTATAAEIGQKYKYIFVDEYQDTNEAQDKIFRAIAVNSKRFMVGDIKQSIYRFRGAEPNIFAYYRENWKEINPATDGDNPEGSDIGNVLLMSDNFRSAEPVTLLTNAVSSQLMAHGGIPYTSGDNLICSLEGGKSPSHPNAEVVLLEEKKKDDNDTPDIDSGNDNNDDGSTKKEIEYVAARIKSMIGTYMNGEIVKAEDIAILMRKKDHAPLYCKALAKYMIPAVVADEFPLIKNPSVVLLMCILNFIDNPLRDVYTAGALRSPVFGFSSGDLTALRKFEADKPLFLCVAACAGSDDESCPDLKEKCINAISWLEKQKTVSRGMVPSKYIEYLIEEIDIFAIDEIREDGNERNAVNRFCTMATTFEAASSSAYGRTDLSAFIEYAEENLQAGEKSDSAGSKTVENAVSIMTIHSSKGLEYPIVFIVDCEREIRSNKEPSASIVFNKDIGFGMYLPDETGMAKCNTIFRRAILTANLDESLNEEMRILYVAMSRAQTKLIITANVKDIDKFNADIDYNTLVNDGYSVKKSNSYISWIMESLKKNLPPRIDIKMLSYDKAMEQIAEYEGKSVSNGTAEAPIVSEYISDFKDRLNFEYDYGYLSNIPAILTVTKLSPSILDVEGEEEPEECDISEGALDSPKKYDRSSVKLTKPNFMIGEITVSPTERGNATHAFLQFVDYKNLKAVGVEEELKRLVDQKYISPGYASVVNRGQIDRFASSEFIDKLMRSDLLEREFRFFVRMDASELTTDPELKKQYEANDVKVNITGVVDCIFRDPDTRELTVVDYKTDALNDELFRDHEKAAELLKERHSTQLSYYRTVCEKIFLEKIPHVYIYSTVIGELIEI